MDWLRFWKLPCIRINGSDIEKNNGLMFSLSRTDSKTRLVIDGEPADVDAIKVVWYRRWAFDHEYRAAELFSDESNRTRANTFSAYSHLDDELKAVSRLFFSMLGSAVWLGHPSNSIPNKLVTLKLAAELGLEVPRTMVTNNLEDLQQFVRECGEVVTKPASDVLRSTLANRVFGTYTSVVPESMLKDEPWQASFPSMFQEKLEKRYEIRVFYLDGKCYSMAMFTQDRASTSVDFRKYSYGDPVRTVPYMLPAKVEALLRELMRSLRLETGSIDMVRATDGRFVFLEVNPVGQFGMVSRPCNYFLERKVATALADRLSEERQKA